MATAAAAAAAAAADDCWSVSQSRLRAQRLREVRARARGGLRGGVAAGKFVLCSADLGASNLFELPSHVQ